MEGYLVDEMIGTEISATDTGMEDDEVIMVIMVIAGTGADDPMITDGMRGDVADLHQLPAHPVLRARAHRIPAHLSDLSQNMTISKINNYSLQSSH